VADAYKMGYLAAISRGKNGRKKAALWAAEGGDTVKPSFHEGILAGLLK
jgi:hypothetical protein